MRSGNPVLNNSTFDAFRSEAYGSSSLMTVQGAATKTLILLGLCVGMASMTWGMVKGQVPSAAYPWMIGGIIGGLVLGFVTQFKPSWSPVTAPLYAMAEGLALGGISAVFEQQFHGIVFQALTATFGTTFALLLAYQTGWIKATQNFRLGVFAATGGIAIMYLVMFLLRAFGVYSANLMSMGLVGLGISAFVVVVAALNLVLDFDYIEQAASQGAPKYCEWYGAFGLMVTLVWLYIEILRLLAIIAGRSRD
ncbi:MAG: Bax inhibitor-1/YccA family protein [Planctomycetes bacterium]|nr:Bax inhibitor-1/YccA family protein [Planctomycetota bacterium]